MGGQFLQPAASQQIMASAGDVSTSGRKVSAASTKSSFNRFSVFVKSGSENFMLGKVNTSVPEQDVLTILVREKWWGPSVVKFIILGRGGREVQLAEFYSTLLLCDSISQEGSQVQRS